MKRYLALLLALLFSLAACGQAGGGETTEGEISVVATTYPIYLFALEVTKGVEGITVTPLVNQATGCLHDYTLTTDDMKLLEGADILLRNGAGLDDFVLNMELEVPMVDCSVGVEPPGGAEMGHGIDYGQAPPTPEESQTQSLGLDPHFWMDPGRAAIMIQNIAAGLDALTPENREAFEKNAEAAKEALTAAREGLSSRLNTLTNRDLVTFHDGFAYFADAANLTILLAVESEEGQEVPAAALQEAVTLVEVFGLPAVFTEKDGPQNAAQVISSETGAAIYSLTMIMSGALEPRAPLQTYLDAINENVNAVLRALQ